MCALSLRAQFFKDKRAAECIMHGALQGANISKTNESNINKVQLKLYLGETTSKVSSWTL